MSNLCRVLCLVFAGGITTLFYISTTENASLSTYSVQKREATDAGTPHNDNSIIYTSHCELPSKDPWDPSIIKFVNSSYKEFCEPIKRIVSSLSDGRIVINDSYTTSDMCQARCVWQKTEWSVKFGRWQSLDKPIKECDIVGVRCNASFFHNPTYEMLHTHIIEKKNEPDYGTHKTTDIIPEAPLEADQPSVYMMVIDSTSSNQLKRELAKTHNYLLSTFKAVEFNYVNKIAYNSRSNSFGLLMGLQAAENGRSIYGPGRKPDDTSCKSKLDDKPFIGFEFRDLGYHTFQGDDWGSGAFQYPNCRGFDKSMAKHNLNAFFQSFSGNQQRTYQFFKDTCHMVRDDMIEYYEQFLNAYKNESQFSIVWESALVHGGINGLFQLDDKYKQLFERNKERFDNAFVVFQGDHGMRFGNVRNTSVGEIEDFNPFLVISVPKKYRNTKAYEHLKSNADKLVSHYDVHATLVQIAKMAKHSNYSLLSTSANQPYRTSLGSSLLSPLPEPRHCGSLGIPFQFCLCKRNFGPPLDPSHDLLVQLSQQAEIDLNSILVNAGVKSSCAYLKVIPSKTVVQQLHLDGVESYNVKVTVEPSGGIFEGYYRVDQKNGLAATLMGNEFYRKNEYGQQAYCIKHESVNHLCYCHGYGGSVFKFWRRLLGWSGFMTFYSSELL
ncbi:hypothetical protein L596_019728 [Steinernema carpocapsae]|uniref:Uncharacterized protein n=1 Tax=Steinernema carpocapsae TaxID=34508 RepID=A0A4U5MRX8_STECR|nr:hypothetical protein L596_019728 [Steinernema carpocapsae]